jgi:putative hydrolase of the HAD superfamily
MNAVRAVFFDLGKTLMYARSLWRPVLLRSNKAVAQALADAGLPVDLHTFADEFTTRLHRYYRHRDETLRETTTLRLLRQLLTEKGLRDVPTPILRAALDAKYAITQTNWHAEEDAHSTLRTLKRQGYLLALLSNAGDDPDVQALLDKFRFRSCFDFVLTSAACGYRKPHTAIFQQALEALNLSPRQAVMVGDTLRADIRGAQHMGIYAVWINRRVNPHTQTLTLIRPDATVRTLAEIPALLKHSPTN